MDEGTSDPGNWQNAAAQPPLQPSGISSAEYLKNLCMELSEIHNNRDFNTPLFDHLTPEFITTHEAGSETIYSSKKQDALERWRRIFENCPDIHSEVLNVNVQLEGKGERAKVWVLRSVTGLPDGLRAETVGEFDWVRRQGRWWCWAYKGLRSFPWYEGEMLYGVKNSDTPESSASGGSGNAAPG